MEIIQDILAAIGVVLNGIPQGLLALTYGFASVPTAMGFIIGAIACVALGSVVPISFQAETIVLAGTMGKNLKERLSMVFFAGIAMVILGATGLLSVIVDFAGPTIIHGMMAGVGFMLARIALDMAKSNAIVGYISIATAAVVYFFMGQNLVYTIIISLVVSSIAAKMAKQTIGENNVSEAMGKLKLHKPIFNFNVARGAMALTCLTIGANIAFASITGSIAGVQPNIDHVTMYSGLADSISALFGGGPVEAIISATASAPHAITSGVIMMIIMAAILFTGLLPKIGKFVPSESIAGFLFILGAVVTVGNDAPAAFSEDPMLGGVTMVVTACTDPFVGMISGLALKFVMTTVGL